MARCSYLAPAGLAFGALFALPFLAVLDGSTRGRDPLGGYLSTRALDGWRDVLSAPTRAVIARSVGLAAGTTLACVILAVLTSMWILRQSQRTRRLALFIASIPLFLNPLMLAYGHVLLLRLDGPLNRALLALGLARLPLALLYSPSAVAAGLVSGYISFAILPVYASIHAISRRYTAVAQDLGATEWQIARHVTLPLLVPTLIAVSAFVFVPMVSEFVIPEVLGGARSVTLGAFIQMQYQSASNWPLGAALAVTSIALSAVLQSALVARSDSN